MLVMSNFSFSHSVIERLMIQTCKNQGLFGKGLSTKHMHVCIIIYHECFIQVVNDFSVVLLIWFQPPLWVGVTSMEQQSLLVQLD